MNIKIKAQKTNTVKDADFKWTVYSDSTGKHRNVTKHPVFNSLILLGKHNVMCQKIFFVHRQKSGKRNLGQQKSMTKYSCLS